MNVLFVCNQNQNRSKTAEQLFQGTFTTRSAGLYNEHPVREAQVEWADILVVMEDAQRQEFARRFPKQYLQKRIISLDIPDVFRHNQPELVELLKSKVQETLLPLW